MRFTAIALVLVVATVSFAEISVVPQGFLGVYNGQSAVGAILNNVGMAHGDTGSSLNGLQIINNQEAKNVHDIKAEQNQKGFLNQWAKADIDSATIGIAQEIGANGNQAQLIGSGVGDKYQGQDAALAGIQTMTKEHGTVNDQIMRQGGKFVSDQSGKNVAGNVDQNSKIESNQVGKFQGAPGTTALISSAVTAGTAQEQYVSN